MMSFVYNWELTLVSAPWLSVVCIVFVAVGIATGKLAARESASYPQASEIAGEVLSAVKTVTAFEGQVKELRCYAMELVEAENVGYKRALITNCRKRFCPS